MEKIPVSILGLSANPGSNGAYALILKETSGNRRLPIIIGSWEAQCIALEIEGISPPRPMTHDLIKTMLDQLGSTVSEVYISELRDGTFFARIIVDGNGPEIDARPSDAIAIAVRFSAPIFVEESVMSQAGFLPEGEESGEMDEPDEEESAIPQHLVELKEAAPAMPQSELEKIQHQLVDAIAHEEYERAAQLRDQLKRLEHGGFA